MNSALFTFLLQLGDDALILGHRLSEWCGHGPMLEEDIALANIALDCLGQAKAILSLAAKIEDKGRDADKLAFFRESQDFLNCLLVEQTNGDFGKTICRQLFYDAFSWELLSRLTNSSVSGLREIAEKALKEKSYHLRHSSEWFIRLADGTDESRRRVLSSIDELWPYTSELFHPDATYQELVCLGIAPPLSEVEAAWSERIKQVFTRAKLDNMPQKRAVLTLSGRSGNHSKHLSDILSEMQSVARMYPQAKW